MIWTDEAGIRRQLPDWSLTGQMLVWADGSPAHVQQMPFEPVGSGWEALVRVNRAARDTSRWLTVRLRLEAAVRGRWEAEGGDPRLRAARQLQGFIHLSEWYRDDLGVLYLQ